MRLENKIAIVTGAGQSEGATIGNGRAAALRFAQEGAHLFLTDRNMASATETAEMVNANGGKAIAFAMDVSNEADCEAMAQACFEAYGRIDILHNNVGIGAGDRGVTSLKLETWQRIFDVNLTSMFLTSKHVLPIMREQKSGVVINISSVAAIAASGMVAYKTSKAGVLALTENIAIANARHGIRANVILPGLMHTPMAVEGTAAAKGEQLENVIAARDAMVPLGGQMGSAWDVANAALFLASDEAKFITGTQLLVDGGQSLKVG